MNWKAILKGAWVLLVEVAGTVKAALSTRNGWVGFGVGFLINAIIIWGLDHF